MKSTLTAFAALAALALPAGLPTLASAQELVLNAEAAAEPPSAPPPTVNQVQDRGEGGGRGERGGRGGRDGGQERRGGGEGRRGGDNNWIRDRVMGGEDRARRSEGRTSPSPPQVTSPGPSGDGQWNREGRRRDRDGDGVPNGRDRDRNGDGQTDRRYRDRDGDGVPNGWDRDRNGDGQTDPRYRDRDRDGVPNGRDRDRNGDGRTDPRYRDRDRDSVPNGRDWDRDGDGIVNGRDRDGRGWDRDRGGNWNRGPDRHRDYDGFRNRWNQDHWRRDWHRNRGYDWWRNDRGFRGYSGFRYGFYFAPGYGYYSVPRNYWGQRWYVGDYLPSIFWRYRLNDWRTFGLGFPPPGTQWVSVDNHIYLVDSYDGYIIEVIFDAWRW